MTDCTTTDYFSDESVAADTCHGVVMVAGHEQRGPPGASCPAEHSR